jgi:hypothetical protein
LKLLYTFRQYLLLPLPAVMVYASASSSLAETLKPEVIVCKSLPTGN